MSPVRSHPTTTSSNTNPTEKRRRRPGRAIWRLLKICAYLGLMLIALVVTGARLLAPHVERLQPQLTSLLEQQLQTTVTMQQVSAEWRGWRPYLLLDKVRVGAAEQALQIDQLRVQLNFATLLLPGNNTLTLEILRPELNIHRDSAQQWHISGFGIPADSDLTAAETNQGIIVDQIFSQADIILIDAIINLQDHNEAWQQSWSVPWMSVAQVPLHSVQQTAANGTNLVDVARQARHQLSALGQPGNHFQVQARLLPLNNHSAAIDASLQLFTNPHLQSVKGYLQAARQPVTPWLDWLPGVSLPPDYSGEVAGQIWFDWKADAVLTATGTVDLDLANAQQQRLAGAASLQLQAHNADWQVTLDRFRLDDQPLDDAWLLVGDNEHGGWTMSSSQLALHSLEPVYRWLQTDRAAASNPDFRLVGQMSPVNIAVDRHGNWLLGAISIRDAYLEFAQNELAETAFCGPLQVEFGLRNQLGSLQLQGQHGLCSIPGFTHRAYTVEQLQVTAQVEQLQNGWRATLAETHANFGDFILGMQGNVMHTPDGLSVDVSAGFDQILATQVQYYLPAPIKPVGGKAWIKRALQGGYVRDGRVAIRGRLADWPLTPEQGQFVTSVQLDNVELDYAQNWPPARQLSARVHIDANQLHTDNARARLLSGDIRGLQAHISELSSKRPDLQLSAALHDDAEGVLNLLQTVPFADGTDFSTRQYDLRGPVVVYPQIGLQLSLKTQLNYARGYADLRGVNASANDLLVENIRGELGFNQTGLLNSELQGVWGQSPAQIRWLNTEAGAEIQMQGEFPVTQVAGSALPQSGLIQPMLAGSSDWLLRLLIERENPSAVLTSNLFGTELRLPEPVTKFASDTQPIRIAVPLQSGARTIAIDYGGVTSNPGNANVMLRLLQDDQHVLTGALLQLQNDEQVNAGNRSDQEFISAQPLRPRVLHSRLPRKLVPQAGQLQLVGTAQTLDPVGWLNVSSLFATPAGPTRPPASNTTSTLQPEVNLQVDQLMMYQRLFGAVKVEYPAASQSTPASTTASTATSTTDTLSLYGDSIQGTLQISRQQSIQEPAPETVQNDAAGELVEARADTNQSAANNDAITINANLQKLHIPAPLVSSIELTDELARLETAQQTDNEQVADEVVDDERIDWLTVHLVCDDFSFQGFQLGQTRIELLPTFNGMNLDTIEARSEAVVLIGRGGWQRTDDGVYSSLNLRLDTEDAGAMLAAFGYDRLVEDAQTTLQLEVEWPGSVGEFDLQKVTGEFNLEANNGSIPAASPGAGRALGLISLQALPRRLFLDFSDVFAEGLEFDRASGKLQFYNGIASTDGIVIDSATALITITGSTDLVKQHYDQLIVVKPGLGLALPIVGALAGGPIGAGVGLAVQGLLGSSISQAAEIRYTVTGPWAEPKLTAIADEPLVYKNNESE